MKPGTVVIVEWDDHCFYSGDFDPKLGIAKQKTVGYFVDKTEKFVRVAMSRTDGKTFAEVLVIDRRMLRTLRRLK